MLEVHAHCGFSGRVRLILKSPRGDRVIEQDNLITDDGLKQLAFSQISNYCGLGSGTTPPTVADQALEAEAARVYRVSTSKTLLPEANEWTAKTTVRYEFAIGTLAGVQINEVGIFASSSGGVMWSRIVLDDTVTVLDDEQLEVQYSLYCHISLAQTTGQVTYGGETYDWVCQIQDVDNAGTRGYNAVHQILLFATPSDTTVAPRAAESNDPLLVTDTARGGIDASSYARDAAVWGELRASGTATWNWSTGNFTTGIGTISLYTNMAYFSIFFTPVKLLKTVYRNITLGFRLTWGRYAL